MFMLHALPPRCCLPFSSLLLLHPTPLLPLLLRLPQVTAPAWPAHPKWLAAFVDVLGYCVVGAGLGAPQLIFPACIRSSGCSTHSMPWHPRHTLLPHCT